MKKKWVRKLFKLLGFALLMVLAAVGYLLYDFTSPRSNDDIRASLSGIDSGPRITYEDFKGKKVRLIQTRKKLDASLPVLFLVHGSPGSSMDFKRYLNDPELNERANLVAYDRIGYGEKYRGEVLGSMEEELELLHQLLDRFGSEQVVLAGYSYGGTLVMASPRKYMKKIVLAPAVRGDLEPMWMLMKLVEWPLTSMLVPKVFRAARAEKLRHLDELPAYASRWVISPSRVVSMHGSGDRIVPYANSLYLDSIFPRGQFELITLEGGNHALIWNEYERIKKEMIKCLSS